MEIGELEKIALFLYGGNMNLIERPKQVNKAEKQVLSERNSQQIMQEQFERIYDKLDELVKAYEGIVLYEGSARNVTLKESSQNFRILQIQYYYSRESNKHYGVIDVPIVGSTTLFTLQDLLSMTSGTPKGSCVLGTISDKKITLNYGNQYEVIEGGYVNYNTVNSYTIIKVIGKK